jgi:hypothetical protein
MAEKGSMQVNWPSGFMLWGAVIWPVWDLLLPTVKASKAVELPCGTIWKHSTTSLAALPAATRVLSGHVPSPVTQGIGCSSEASARRRSWRGWGGLV